MNFLSQGIPLGKWFGIDVIVSWMFFLAVLYFLRGTQQIAWTLYFVFLLFGTVLVHEFGHALSCRAIGGDAHRIVLGPLGGVAYVNPPMNPVAWLITTVCGPLVNAVLWPAFWAITTYGVPALARSGHLGGPALEFILTTCFILWQINKGLLLFNLIPAYPMDGGRLLQEILWFIVGYGRSLMIAGMVGTVAGVGFIVLGLGIESIRIPIVEFQLGTRGQTDPLLAVIGLMCAMQSFGIYRRSQEIQTWRKN